MTIDFIDIFFKKDTFTDEELLSLRNQVKSQCKSEELRKAATSKINLYLALFQISGSTKLTLEQGSSKQKKTIVANSSRKNKSAKNKIEVKESNKLLNKIIEACPIHFSNLIDRLEVKENLMLNVFKKFNLNVDPNELLDEIKIRRIKPFIQSRQSYFIRKKKQERKLTQRTGKNSKTMKASKKSGGVFDLMAKNGGPGKIIYIRS